MSAGTAPSDDLNLREQIAHIDRALAENRKFQAKTDKLVEEGRGLAADARKLAQDTSLAGWPVALAGFTIGAIVIGAIVTLMNVVH